jgi:hypothetical protein
MGSMPAKYNSYPWVCLTLKNPLLWKEYRYKGRNSYCNNSKSEPMLTVPEAINMPKENPMSVSWVGAECDLEKLDAIRTSVHP